MSGRQIIVPGAMPSLRPQSYNGDTGITTEGLLFITTEDDDWLIIEDEA